MPSRKQPVIIGVADVKNASKKVEDAIEPLELILQAIEKAIDDTGLIKPVAPDLLSSVDSLDVVRTWTWPYPDLSGLIAKRLAIKPTRRYYTEQHGGDQPAKLLDGAARRVSLGETKVAIVTGGEALASCTHARSPLHISQHHANNVKYPPARPRRSCHLRDGPKSQKKSTPSSLPPLAN